MFHVRVLLSLSFALALLVPPQMVVSQQAHMGCHSTTPVYGPRNNYGWVEGESHQQLIRSISGEAAGGGAAKLYNVTIPHHSEEESQSFLLTHVWGTPYQKGFAYGAVAQKEVAGFINGAWAFLDQSVVESLVEFMPEWLAKKVAELGLDAALDYTYDITKHFSDPTIYEELKGLAAGAQVDYLTVRRLHQLPGLTKGACSMFGAWNRAVPEGKGLLQLRALDWDMDPIFVDNSAVLVSHSEPLTSSKVNQTQMDQPEHSFVSIAFTGFMGALTGFSETRLGISEIGVSYPDDSFGGKQPEGEIPQPGVPFVFLLRDILKYDMTLDDAWNRMSNAHRTCDLILGVGDGKLGYFRSFEYSQWKLYGFNPLNMRPDADWHPKIPDVVYHGMDWDCPSFNQVLSEELQKFYGNITAENGIQSITAVTQTGSNHIAYYEFDGEDLYFSFAAPSTSAGPANAYDRQFVHYSAGNLWAEKPPQ